MDGNKTKTRLVRNALTASLALATLGSAIIAGFALRNFDDARAASVAPASVSGATPTCDDLEGTYAGGQNWTGASTGTAPESKTYVFGPGSITITIHPGDPFLVDWTSTFGIDAVLIKQAAG